MGKGTESASLQSSRQMLDELDALMERMLALPVTDEEELPPLPRETPRTPIISAALTMLQDALDHEGEVADEHSLLEEHRLWREKPELPPLFPQKPPSYDDPTAPHPVPDTFPSLRHHASASVPRPHRTVDDLQFDVDDADVNIPPPLVITRPPRRTTTKDNPGKEAAAVVPGPAAQQSFPPLLWINNAFDRGTEAFGPLGSWLRRSTGRAFLGFAGVALIAISAAWIAHDYLSWTR